MFSESPAKKCEVKITSELCQALGLQPEVQAPYGLGRIDGLSSKLLIEAKYEGSTALKGALGQLLVYAYALKFKGSLGLAIIGNKPVQPGIHQFCRDNKITIFYYSLSSLRWKVFYSPRKNNNG